MADDDTDTSDWDSSLSFTSPNNRQAPVQHPPRITVTDDGMDERSIKEEVPIPRERTSINTEQNRVPQQQQKNISSAHTVSNSPSTLRNTQTMQPSVNKEKNQQNYRQGDTTITAADEPPPYSFKGQALDSTSSGDMSIKKPGKDRKGNVYDPSPSPIPKRNPSTSDFTVGTWDESDEEKTLRELRTNFNKAKQQETERQEQKLRVQQEEEDNISWKDDDPKSESTWRNITNFGRNSFGIGRSSKKKVKKVPKTDTNNLTMAEDTPLHKQNILKDPKDQSNIQSNIVQTPHTVFEPSTAMTRTDDQELYKTENDGKRHLYFFGKSHTNFYQVTDISKEAFLPRIADKLEKLFTRIWLEFFGFLRIIVSFVIILIVELLRFIILSVIHPIFVIGLLRICGDFIVIPCLSVLFNSCCQPLYICCFHCMTGVKLIFQPIVDIWRSCLEPLATCCLSVKLVQINWNGATSSSNENKRMLQNV